VGPRTLLNTTLTVTWFALAVLYVLPHMAGELQPTDEAFSQPSVYQAMSVYIQLFLGSFSQVPGNVPRLTTSFVIFLLTF